MHIHFQRKLDRYIGALICRILSLFHRKKAPASSRRHANKILVILLSEMGSLVLAYPMLQRLKEKYPAAQLHGLLFEKNKEVLALLDVMPAENILTIRDTSFLTFVLDSLRILFQLRKMKVDIVVDCELFARISSIFSFLSGAGIRAGFHPHTQEGLYRGNFINCPVLYNPYRHMAQQFLTLIAAIGSDSTPKAKQSTTSEYLKASRIHFEPQEIQQMQDRLYNEFESIGDKKLVLIYPGGGILPIRAWPADYYGEVARQLLQKGYAVAIIGLADDKALAAEILSRCNDPACIDLTGYTKTVRELMLIFQFAGLLITNDGGPGQFAAMTPIPSIIFYGPETPKLYGPEDEKAFIFYDPLPCSPCLTAYNHRHSPCDGDNLCLKQIPPDRVLAKALEILNDGMLVSDANQFQ
jgi:ADP-heptose:LPS heptosyltransferase